MNYTGDYTAAVAADNTDVSELAEKIAALVDDIYGGDEE